MTPSEELTAAWPEGWPTGHSSDEHRTLKISGLIAGVTGDPFGWAWILKAHDGFERKGRKPTAASAVRAIADAIVEYEGQQAMKLWMLAWAGGVPVTTEGAP